MGNVKKERGLIFGGGANRQCAGEEEEDKSRERSSSFFLRSTETRSTVFVEVRGKVYLRDKSYAWAPKLGSFVKIQEVGNFPTWIISNLKVI